MFYGNTVKIGKNLTNLARKCFSNIFLARDEIWVVHPWSRITVPNLLRSRYHVPQNMKIEICVPLERFFEVSVAQNYIKFESLVPLDISYVALVSISSTFYARIFCRKANWTAFLYLHLALWFLVPKILYEKRACKRLMKLTPCGAPNPDWELLILNSGF